MRNLYLKIGTLTLATFCLAASPEAATLKKNVTVYEHIVLAKDLFDDAGEFSNEPLFLSPDPGRTGKISASRVVEEAEEVGMDDINLDGIVTVSVTRPSQLIKRGDIHQSLKEHIRHNLEREIDFEIRTSAIPEELHADSRVLDPLGFKNFKLTANQTQFQAGISVQTYAGTQTIPVRGSVIEMKTVYMASRDIERGEVLAAGDLVDERVPAIRLRPGSVTSASILVGKAAVRRLSEGTPIREQDVEEPQIVQSNDRVVISYTIPGLLLTVQGRALDSGPLGATISVMNLQSKRVIQARISNKGEVVVEARNPIFASTAKTPLNEVR